MIGGKPGFYPEPRFISTTDGSYKQMGSSYLVSSHLAEPLFLPHGTPFEPSIPVWCRMLVPVTSNVVVMSLAHDDIFRKQPEGIGLLKANAIAYEILVIRGEKKRHRLRVRAALFLLSFISWNKNKRRLQNEG